MRDVTCIGSWELPENGEVETSTSVTSFASSTTASQKNKSLSTITATGVGNPKNNSSTSGILALRDQKGFGECLQYRKSSSGILQITPGCDENDVDSTTSPAAIKKTRQIVTMSFQGSCQEALMDAHAVSHGICLINFFYSMLTVMTMAILINV